MRLLQVSHTRTKLKKSRPSHETAPTVSHEKVTEKSRKSHDKSRKSHDKTLFLKLWVSRCENFGDTLSSQAKFLVAPLWHATSVCGHSELRVAKVMARSLWQFCFDGRRCSASEFTSVSPPGGWCLTRSTPSRVDCVQRPAPIW